MHLTSFSHRLGLFRSVASPVPPRLRASLRFCCSAWGQASPSAGTCSLLGQTPEILLSSPTPLLPNLPPPGRKGAGSCVFLQAARGGLPNGSALQLVLRGWGNNQFSPKTGRANYYFKAGAKLSFQRLWSLFKKMCCGVPSGLPLEARGEADQTASDPWAFSSRCWRKRQTASVSRVPCPLTLSHVPREEQLAVRRSLPYTPATSSSQSK